LPARAQVIDLIENGGFETGDLTGWIAEPAPSGSAFGVDHGAGFGLAANSGSHWIGFGATEGVYDTISQSLPTTPGAAYNISLWVLNPNTDSDLLVSWGGDTLLHITSSDTLGSYQEFDFVRTASGAATTLAIAGLNAPASIAVDDVSVTVVPEPCGSALACGAALACFVLLRRSQRGKA